MTTRLADSRLSLLRTARVMRSRWADGAGGSRRGWWISPGLKGAVRVLDVGCGTGNLGVCLAEDPEVLGIQGVDITPHTSTTRGVAAAMVA